MSTKRARQHQWVVRRQKTFRYFKRHRGSYYYVLGNQRMGGPRWRTINRAQTALEYAAMKMMNGYGFTREETELAIKILEEEKHDN